MNKKFLLGMLCISIITILLSGCGQRSGSGLIGGACYWKNKIRYNLPTKPVNSAPRSFKSKVASTPDALANFNGDVYVAGENYLGSYYWKNGDYYYLDGDHAEDVFVEGTDVYTAGDYMGEDSQLHACYWKNFDRIDLDGALAFVIFVKDSVVYSLGVYGENGKGVGCYWINDVRYTVKGMHPTGIFVDGSDIYLSGWFDNSEGQEQGCYWKNGVIVPLNNRSANSITIVNNNIYLTGDGMTNDAANSLHVDGTDVYIAGSYVRKIGDHITQGTPCFWKNGQLTDLSIYNTGRVYDIWASGSDVMVLGYDGIWYNEQTIGVSGFPHAIYVVKR